MPMFLTEGKSNYDAVLTGLLEEAKSRNAAANAPALGGSLVDGSAQIPLFGDICVVKDDAVYKGDPKLDTIGSILVLRYLLTAGDDPLRNAWVPYRDFKDGAQFAFYIKANIEDLLAKTFAGNQALLRERLQALGASMYRSEAKPDVAAALRPLPRVPLLVIFWDKDEEFDASFQFLFDESAESFLDMEALAVLLEYTCQKLIGGQGL
ncbi:MAG TPA: DUF3786 domain-containing protein [Syntrophorhabdales bacterium]|nr:DUF3786 domain-containing protein [Syntrophorhabdales bacterium]